MRMKLDHRKGQQVDFATAKEIVDGIGFENERSYELDETETITISEHFITNRLGFDHLAMREEHDDEGHSTYYWVRLEDENDEHKGEDLVNGEFRIQRYDCGIYLEFYRDDEVLASWMIRSDVPIFHEGMANEDYRFESYIME